MMVIPDGFCHCGCGGRTTLYRGKYRKYISGHNGRGENNGRYKGGEFVNFHGYVQKKCVGHPQADINGYYEKHRWVYEQHYNCCLLKHIEIHHINGIKTDNRIENLQPLTKSAHTSITNTKDMSDRRCSNTSCRTPTKTHYDKRGWYVWFHDGNGGWLCRRCYRRQRYKLTGKS